MDQLGKILLAGGALTDVTLEELLDLQKVQLPLASLCHLLGVAGEETLVRALSKQAGLPGIVLSRSVIDLAVIDSVPREIAFSELVVPVLDDGRRIFCAVARPVEAGESLRQISFVTGKPVVPHVALHVVLMRMIRELYAARSRGEVSYRGSDVVDVHVERGREIWVVSDADTVPPGAMDAMAVEASVEEVTMEVSPDDLGKIADEIRERERELESDSDTTSLPTSVAGTSSETTEQSMGSSATPLSDIRLEPITAVRPIDLDASESRADRIVREPGGPSRVLVVDDDFATRNLLVKELAPDGYGILTAGNGGEAVRIIKSDPPNAVIIDVMLPQIDGFQVCRSIKSSTKYRHIPVILMSAVIDSGRVTDEVLRRYQADAYFEKPLNTSRLRDQLRSLLAQSKSVHAPPNDASFERALGLYRSGRFEEAIDELRDGLLVDPLSGRHHFVLANLLQKQSLFYEAIDEYETTVELMPDYFPALTRLAYLYYKKGFSAKAIEVWRRALPHCPDVDLRKNIEVFMRKLIADMQSELS